MVRQELSAAEYVSKREAGRVMEKALLIEQQNAALVAELEHVERIFGTGRKLSTEQMQQLVGNLRASIKATDPIGFAESVSADGSTYELRFMSRFGEEGLQKVAITSRVIQMTRRRLTVVTTCPTFDYSRHVLERAMERDVAAWGASFADVEQTLWDSVGLMVVWRRAFAKGLVDNDQVALPLGDGLILGHLFKYQTRHALTEKLISGRDAFTRLKNTPSPLLLTADGDHFLAARFSTTLSFDLMRAEQICLKESLDIFQAKYRRALQEVTAAVLWSESGAMQHMSPADVDAAVSYLAGELAEIVADPSLRNALRGPAWLDEARRNSEHQVEVEPEPEAPAMAF